jgi:hypothetical protein
MGEAGVQLMDVEAGLTWMGRHSDAELYCEVKLDEGVHCTHKVSEPPGRIVLAVAAAPPTDVMV